MFSPEMLMRIMPKIPATMLQPVYFAHLRTAMQEGEITTVTRAAAFLAQLGWESGDLRYMEEIADGSAYEGRKDLGNVKPGDGPRYKGRGPIQLTGRDNYRKAGETLGLPLEDQPWQAAMPEVGFHVAVWYWTTHKLNDKADNFDFDGITRAINGGLNGKAGRDARYYNALQVLGTGAIIEL